MAFFPSAKVQVKPHESNVEILYYRPNGKGSKQLFHTQPLENSAFMQVQATEFSQNNLKPEPLFDEPKLVSIENWAIKINQKTGTISNSSWMLQLCQGDS